MKQSYKQTTSKNKVDAAVLTMDQVFANDLKNSILIVSVLTNVTILIAYMVVQITSAYDHQVISLLLTN